MCELFKNLFLLTKESVYSIIQSYNAYGYHPCNSFLLFYYKNVTKVPWPAIYVACNIHEIWIQKVEKIKKEGKSNTTIKNSSI